MSIERWFKFRQIISVTNCLTKIQLLKYFESSCWTQRGTFQFDLNLVAGRWFDCRLGWMSVAFLENFEALRSTSLVVHQHCRLHGQSIVWLRAIPTPSSDQFLRPLLAHVYNKYKHKHKCKHKNRKYNRSKKPTGDPLPSTILLLSQSTWNSIV